MKNCLSILRKTPLGDKKALQKVTISEFAEQCRMGKHVNNVRELRRVLPFLENDPAKSPYFSKLKEVFVASDYKRIQGQIVWGGYNGVVMLTVGDNITDGECERIKHQAALLPQTLMAVRSFDAKHVLVFVCVSLQGGQLPAEKSEAELLHQLGYHTAVLGYGNLLAAEIMPVCAGVEESFTQTYDEDPYVNENAVPFILSQPSKLEIDNLTAYDETDMKPMGEDTLGGRMLFASCFGAVLESKGRWTWDKKPDAVIVATAKRCAKAGLEEEECVVQLSYHFDDLAIEVIRAMVHNVYRANKVRTSVSAMPKKQISAFKLREFMCRRYDIRYNEILRSTEFRSRNSHHIKYRMLSPRELNTIKTEVAMEGIEVFDSEIRGLIDSTFVPVYNPVDEYFRSLPVWDGKDHIGELAAMVPTYNENWSGLFRRWFLSMVAHWIEQDKTHANATAPVLIGAQGFRKSTFCRILLPPELREYFTDSIDFRNNVEAERYLGRFLLVNIDEFDQLTESQFAFVKHLFQKPTANIRRSYSQSIEAQRRYASFIATTNHSEVLRDPTGNRRYICIEVHAPIRVETPVNYAQLYSQALTLIRQGERTFMNDDDETKIKDGNMGFDQKSPIEYLFQQNFEIVQDGGEWYFVAEIVSALQKSRAYEKRRHNPYAIGRVLHKLGAKSKRVSNGRMYYLRKIHNS